MKFSKFLGGVFGSKPVKQSSKKPSQDWTVFERLGKDGGVISVDVKSTQLHHFNYNYFAHVEYSFERGALNEVGMPNNDTQHAFFSFEDTLEQQESDLIKVASLVSPGKRSVWFASKQPSIVRAIEARQHPHEGFTSRVSAARLSQITTLMPTHIENQMTQNRKILETLWENGDDGTVQRKIRHWFFHSENSDSSTLIKALTKLGFEIEESHSDRLLASNYSNLEIDTVNQETQSLNEIAKSCSAQYDGWETEVVSLSRTLN